MRRMVGSAPWGSETKGMTADAPGCRIISSCPVDSSGNRTVSMSRSSTRAEYMRLLSSFIRPLSTLKQPGKGHLEPFGKQIPSIAAKACVDRRAGGRRCVGREPEPSRNDLHAQHVKAVADEQDPTAFTSREPVLHLLQRCERVVPAREWNHGFVGHPQPQQVISPDIGLIQRITRTHAAGHEYRRCEAALIQHCRVVESRAQHGG